MRNYLTKLKKIEQEMGIGDNKSYIIIRDYSGLIAKERNKYPAPNGMRGYLDKKGHSILILEDGGREIDPASKKGQKILRGEHGETIELINHIAKPEEEKET